MTGRETRDGHRLVSLSDIALPGPGGPRRDRFARDVAALVARQPWRPGNRILLAGNDAYAVAVGLFAALHGGCKALFPANLQAGHLAEVAATADGVVTAGGGLPALSVPSLPALAADMPDRAPPLARLDLDGAAIVLHTSGTTGEPLAVDKTLGNLDAEVAVLEQTFGADVADAVTATVPPYHIYGLLFRVLWPLATGRGFDGPAIAFPEEIAPCAEAAPGIALVSSPAFLRRVLPVLDLDALRDRIGPIFSSGGPLPPEVAAAYNAKLRFPVTEVYGATETGGIAYRRVFDAGHPPAWIPMPPVEVSIDPADGVLSVRSPYLPTAGWFRTADIATPRDGGFDLRGRGDRVVKLQEQRISLTDVERRLADCPEVAEVRVVPVLTGKAGREALAAVIRPTAKGWEALARDGKRAMTVGLTAAIRPFLQTSSLPRRWRFVRQLPVGDGGKVTMAGLLSLFEPGLGHTIAPTVLEETLAEDGFRVVLHLTDDLFYFKGHFDQAPILAGVVQIDWAIRFAEKHYGITPRLNRIEVLKFFDVLSSNRDVRLTLNYEAPRNRLSFRYDGEDRKFSSGRIILEAAP